MYALLYIIITYMIKVFYTMFNKIPRDYNICLNNIHDIS